MGWLSTARHNRAWFLDALKKRVKEAQEQDQIAMLAKAMIDRRQQDFSDIVSEQECLVGWQRVVNYLVEAKTSTHPVSFDMSSRRSTLEPLKYREVLFGLLACNGLEPTMISTDEILDIAAQEGSLIDASRSILQELLNIAEEQIRDGDILFFDFDSADSAIPSNMVSRIQTVMKQQSAEVRFEERNGHMDVSCLWYTGGGLQALLQLGIHGNLIDADTLDVVLSVIQPPLSNTTPIKNRCDAKNYSLNFPSLNEFRELHHHIIRQDIDGLESLGSKYAIPTLAQVLNQSVSSYEDRKSSNDYRNLLRIVGAHVRIRSLESIPILERLCYLDETRIVNPAVVALASFYHESAVHALGRLLCTTSNPNIVETILNAIANISNRCPETQLALEEVSSTDCERPTMIRKILRRIRKRKYQYYL